MIIGYKFDRLIKIDDCDICIKAKITAKPSRQLSKQVVAFLQLVYSDICGLIIPKIPSRKRYVITFIDSAIK